VQGAPDAPWTWSELPAMSVGRHGSRGCVMSDGRFAVLGGVSSGGSTSSCEALVVGDDAQWEPLAAMHESRMHFACAAVAGCVIIAGGCGHKSAEVYDVLLDRWFRLPRDSPHTLGWCGWVARFCSRPRRLLTSSPTRVTCTHVPQPRCTVFADVY
jgi:hypothetical protein